MTRACDKKVSARSGCVDWIGLGVQHGTMSIRFHAGLLALATLLLLGACGTQVTNSEISEPSTVGAVVDSTLSTNGTAVGDDGGASLGKCADVVGVEIDPEAAGTFNFSVTVSSDETGWDKYADAWEVRTTEGEVLAERILVHPHENEQPFTRSLGGVEMPDGTNEVVVVARDSVLGFCGAAYSVSIPG